MNVHRILEHEIDQGQIPVELWDCSGDQRYENGWGTLLKDAKGVILCYNPQSRSQEHEASLWFESFIQSLGLDGNQCLILAHTMNGRNNGSGNLRLPINIRTVHSDMESLATLREEYEEFIVALDKQVSRRK